MGSQNGTSLLEAYFGPNLPQQLQGQIQQAQQVPNFQPAPLNPTAVPSYQVQGFPSLRPMFMLSPDYNASPFRSPLSDTRPLVQPLGAQGDPGLATGSGGTIPRAPSAGAPRGSVPPSGNQGRDQGGGGR
jgi:hypothetical protein